MIVIKKVYNMGIRGNSGFKVQDKRFGTSGTPDINVKGVVSRHQHFLERTEGRFDPIVPSEGVFYKTYINEDFESGNFITDFATTSNTYRWVEVNTDTPNLWYVGTDRPFAGTYSAYISNDGGTTNAYTDAGGSDNFIKLQFRIPTDIIPEDTLANTGHTMDISFQWRCVGEGTTVRYDYGYLLYTTTAFTINSGTLVTTARILGDTTATNQFDDEYQTPGGYSNWYEQTGSLLVDGSIGDVLQLTWAWHDDAVGGTVGNPPFAIDNIVLKYSGSTAP